MAASSVEMSATSFLGNAFANATVNNATLNPFQQALQGSPDTDEDLATVGRATHPAGPDRRGCFCYLSVCMCGSRSVETGFERYYNQVFPHMNVMQCYTRHSIFHAGCDCYSRVLFQLLTDPFPSDHPDCIPSPLPPSTLNCMTPHHTGPSVISGNPGRQVLQPNLNFSLHAHKSFQSSLSSHCPSAEAGLVACSLLAVALLSMCLPCHPLET